MSGSPDYQITSSEIQENDAEIKIPVEIVSDEEMAFIEAAFSLASRRSSLSVLCSTSFQSISIASTRSFSSSIVCNDVEDLGKIQSPQRKKNKVSDSLLSKFRKNRGLSVTDLTSTEWCEKQMEFVLTIGRPEKTNAMKAGITRHAKLEEEVSKKVEVRVQTLEDIWAVKFINFIICANQLLFDGLTREIPIVGFVQGVWMVGVIDELRMPVTGNGRKLTLVDTKTRVQPRLPTEPQRRNGRLQLMFYKRLLDNMISNNFPSEQFYVHFSMDPHNILSDEVKMNAADSGFPAETLGEVVRYVSNVCSVLPPVDDQLLLRYELQADNSLIGEDEFNYDEDWLKAQMHSCLEFWQGEREAKYVPAAEKWKCQYCKFATVCPQTDTETESQSSVQGS
ncbi:exonuclease V, chloroplastic isoform X2 [Spinacia oleracea]|uniref:Exonuclease V, chloroplastic isoform X2 n=1 Tax=Spinacia oleracea TaxID=3562 RepID=A0A9R0HTS2_SPIOL|nr:exonuclease V, chloroplastic isoform X2 [Spinacia oleracea]XP_021836912.2 exonuclease V, chloroplastic isoform X2 [Spinacia oleracea]XP_021836913.2 exonuclease V, chloroplastic isoform X2 [Spinacia oleracea]